MKKKYNQYDDLSSTRKYNIPLLKLLLICIFIMFFEKIIIFFKQNILLLPYGNLTYHIISFVLSIAVQLAASIAAAIIFYFCLEFMNKKRDMPKYIDLQRILSLLISTHFSILSSMNVIKNINGVSELTLLFNHFTDENWQDLSEKTKIYIENNVNFSNDLSMYQSEIDKLQECRGYGYIRYSYHRIESITKEFENIKNGYTLYTVYKHDKLEEVARSYVNFIRLTYTFEEDINAFIEYINKYRIVHFLRMLE